MIHPKILIVDDIPGNVKLPAATLGRDYRTCVADNGNAAIRIVGEDSSIDLIILDIMMPGIDGYEVCRRLKADAGTRHIPIIFVTAKDDDVSETKGFELGAVDFIRKLIKPAVVRARVKTHVQLHRVQQKLLESKTNRFGCAGAVPMIFTSKFRTRVGALRMPGSPIRPWRPT